MKTLFGVGGLGVLLVVFAVVLGTVGYVKVRPGYEVALIPVVGSGSATAEVQVLTKGRKIYPAWKYDEIKNPTYIKEYVWTADRREGSPEDESVKFQSKDPLDFTANIGARLRLKPGMSGELYGDVHKDVDDLIDTGIYNSVRSGLTLTAQNMTAVEIYEGGKDELLKGVKKTVEKQWGKYFIIEEVFFTSPLTPPTAVTKAINAKIAATQAAAKEMEKVAGAKALRLQKKERTDAETYDIRQRALAEAESIKIVRKQLTPEYTQYLEVMKWNGSRATTVVPAMVLGEK